ncbi:MAG: hypothetical protein LC624_08150 [Halobacteriales archaeon]|nr:hypothetical protein [Halobacteriales archaeon]
MSQPERMARNEAIVRQQMQRDVEEGAKFLEQRAGALFTGLGGLLLNPLAGAAAKHLGHDQVVKRAHRRLDHVIAAARLHDAGHDVIDDHFHKYLAEDEAYARADPKHPRFSELRGHIRDGYFARVEPIALMVHHGMGSSYGELMRSVCPSRPQAQSHIERECQASEAIIVLAETEPQLLRAPAMLRPQMLGILRETYTWYRGRMHRTLDEVYG